MLRKLIVPFILITVLLAACGQSAAPTSETTQGQSPAEIPTEAAYPAPSQPTPEQPAEQPVEQAAEQPTAAATAEVYPPPINLPVIGVGAYPEPSEEVGSGIVEPGQGDDDQNTGSGKLVEGEIFIDQVTVNVGSGDLPQVELVVTGNLPSPCYQFAAEIGQPDPDGKIDVRVYSLVDPEAQCAQMLQPFEEMINLGVFPSGSYTILVNGEVVQELDF